MNNQLIKLSEIYKSLKDIHEIGIFWEIMCDGGWWYTKDNEHLCKYPVVEFCVSIYRKYIEAQAVNRERINTMVENAYLHYVTEVGFGEDRNKYVIQCQAVIFPIMFQPPVVTSGVSEERMFINAVFCRWDNIGWQKHYYELLDKRFKRGKYAD